MYLARVCSPSGRVQTRCRVRRPYRLLHLVPAGPGGAPGVDVDLAQIAVKQPLVEGGDRDGAEADLQAVLRHRPAVDVVGQSLQLPEMAEVVLGTRRRSRRPRDL